MSRTVTLTSKNQITLPAALVRQAGFAKGVKFTSRLQGGAIVLEPQRDLRKTVESVQGRMQPLIKRPISDAEIQRALHNWQ